jgi:hypothetical protein
VLLIQRICWPILSADSLAKNKHGLAEAKPQIIKTRTVTYLGCLPEKRIMRLNTINGDMTKKNGKASEMIDTMAPP